MNGHVFLLIPKILLNYDANSKSSLSFKTVNGNCLSIKGAQCSNLTDNRSNETAFTSKTEYRMSTIRVTIARNNSKGF